jgi:hypothetical protein
MESKLELKKTYEGEMMLCLSFTSLSAHAGHTFVEAA